MIPKIAAPLYTQEAINMAKAAVVLCVIGCLAARRTSLVPAWGTLLHGWCDALDNSKPSVGEGESEVLGFLREVWDEGVQS